MKKLTPKGVKRYLTKNYGECRHNESAAVIACRKVAREIKCSPKDVFHFMFENTPIPGVWTHSYGFHTRTGREIRYQFEYEYYENI